MSGKDARYSRREVEAAELHREGRTVAEVAAALGVSPRKALRRIRAGEALFARLARAQAAASPRGVYRLVASRLRQSGDPP